MRLHSMFITDPEGMLDQMHLLPLMFSRDGLRAREGQPPRPETGPVVLSLVYPLPRCSGA